MTADGKPFEPRRGTGADGNPTLLVGLQLNQEQCHALVACFKQRAESLKAQGWEGWCEVDMALRTLCVQIEAHENRVFWSG